MRISSGFRRLRQKLSRDHSPQWRKPTRTLALAMVSCCFGQALLTAQGFDLTQVSLEDLMNLQVTSVSKKEQKIFRSPAAIFVITAEDIRRSGARVLPDALRNVPGLDVAQIDGSHWAISARGFNSQYSDKLLVMIDGQTVYNPLFAGVFWDMQSIPLETIERIEVIRGPGAAIWGTNAVNGVINIITKSSADSQGGMLSVSTGGSAWDTQGPDFMRYGAPLGHRGHYRVTASGFNFSPNRTATGADAHDHWRVLDTGFRTDLRLSSKDSLISEGRVYQSQAGEMVQEVASLYPPVESVMVSNSRSSGWNFLTRWDRSLAGNASTTLQASFQHGNRNDSAYGVSFDIWDIDFQHHFHWTDRHDLVWGLGSRVSTDSTAPGKQLMLNPASKALKLFNGFLQDEISLQPNRLTLTVGARLEHNDFTDFDVEPTIRLAWSPQADSTIWAAFSGADRTPARGDTALKFVFAVFALPGGLPPAEILLSGNPQVKDEELKSYEIGERQKFGKSLTLDLTAFYNHYHHLEFEQVGTPYLSTDPLPHLVIPGQFENTVNGETHGLETFANWRVNHNWTLSSGYAFYAEHLHAPASGEQAGAALGLPTETPDDTQGVGPTHQAQLRSSVSLPWRLQWNTSAYFVDTLPQLNLPSYTRLDSGLLWQAGERTSLSINGQNLLKDRHAEFNSPGPLNQSSTLQRGVYAKLTWAF